MNQYSRIMEEICERIQAKIIPDRHSRYDQGLLDAWSIIMDVREKALRGEIEEEKRCR